MEVQQGKSSDMMRLGVPLCKASGSRFPLQVLAGLPAAGFQLESLTQIRATFVPIIRCQ